MAVQQVTGAREIIAEADTVWKVITDIDKYPRTRTSVMKVERTSGPGFEVGTAWTEQRYFLGASASFDVEVTAIEDGKSYAIASSIGDSTFSATYRLLPSSLGTRLEAEMAVDSGSEGMGGWLKSMMGGGGAKAVKQMFEQDLDDFVASIR